MMCMCVQIWSVCSDMKCVWSDMKCVCSDMKCLCSDECECLCFLIWGSSSTSNRNLYLDRIQLHNHNHKYLDTHNDTHALNNWGTNCQESSPVQQVPGAQSTRGAADNLQVLIKNDTVLFLKWILTAKGLETELVHQPGQI